MTKDRRLGKGLAALLGTPLDEEDVVDGEVARPAPPSAPSPAARSRNEGKQQRSGVTGVTGAVPLADTTSAKAVAESDEQSAEKTLQLSVYEIDNNPFQPRRKFNEQEIAALAESIKEHQQLQPILVRQVGERYQLISGERRLRAAIHAGLQTIRAELREADDRLVAELAIVENLQRKDLDPIEKAMSFRRYIDEHGCKQDDLAKRLKIDRSTIANLMRLLELPKPIREAVQEERLTAGHARAILPLGDESQQLEFASQCQAEGWTVRETERRVSEQLASEDGVIAGKIPAASKPKASPQIAALEQDLRLALGTKTEIRQNAKGKGKISISFANNEEFERVMALICPQVTKRSA